MWDNEKERESRQGPGRGMKDLRDEGKGSVHFFLGGGRERNDKWMIGNGTQERER